VAASSASSAVTAGGTRRPEPVTQRLEPEGGPAVSGDDAARLASLRRAKLGALVQQQWGSGSQPRPASFAGGAALVDGSAAWVLIDDGDARRLGAALVWARRQGVDHLDVLVETAADPQAAGVVARRALEFTAPAAVWAVAGRDLTPAPPAPVPVLDPVPDGAAALAGVLVEHGADPVVEHGVLRGEVLGLEVARVVPGDGGWRIAAGVGRHDREARTEMHPGHDPLAALDQVVADVRAWRVPGVRAHPANTLARERWLRSVIVAHPELAGAGSLRPVAPATIRVDLRDGVPAPAVGIDADGDALVVVCSTGVDMDLVPSAADVRRRENPSARLVLVVPESDAYPVTRELAAALREPATIVAIPGDWVSLSAGS
jgi:hypothetical protein